MCTYRSTMRVIRGTANSQWHHGCHRRLRIINMFHGERLFSRIINSAGKTYRSQRGFYTSWKIKRKLCIKVLSCYTHVLIHNLSVPNTIRSIVILQQNPHGRPTRRNYCVPIGKWILRTPRFGPYYWHQVF